MAETWSKLKKSLSLRLCAQQPLSLDATFSSLRQLQASDSDSRSAKSTSSSSGFRFSRSGSRTSQKTCAICLGTMRVGQGHALFTAECSHSFHFNCIASSVKHGNEVCPVCRSQWKEIPFQAPSPADRIQIQTHDRVRMNPLDIPQSSEPPVFSDDDPLPTQTQSNTINKTCASAVKIKTFPELPAVPASDFVPNFSVLVNIKAPPLSPNSNPAGNSSSERAPVDLVAVIDVSGSMAGTKLQLVKRAVLFVIQNLGPDDRLSVVAFSSTARRLFHLRGMDASGRNRATLAVNSLVSSGGTNIVDGLNKGVKVLQERRERNPVCSIILLSDGQDTYNTNTYYNRRISNFRSSAASESRRVLDYQYLLPPAIRRGGSASVPVHTFGFGSDHDATAMHIIADTSGGTFSFIQAESSVQDAFARCIGGLLSVVAQELQLVVSSAAPNVRINSIPAGNYTSEVSDCGRRARIDVGDLYADEEKDFLVNIELSSSDDPSEEETAVMTVACSYKEPTSQVANRVNEETVTIRRPESLSGEGREVCLEVDRQRNRVLVAESIAEAQAMAERGELEGAQSLLASRRSELLSSFSARAGDGLCSSLDAELKEIGDRMASMQLYEQTGRAYVLSGMSSHSWQRATTRPGVAHGSGVSHYDTPSMTEMITRSQTLVYDAPEFVARPLHLSRSCTLAPRRGFS